VYTTNVTMAPITGKDHPEALALAQLFSTCVECFGLIHPRSEWDHQQRLSVAKLGIQQGRLLAWGDMVGILDISESRDSRLEDPEMRKTIETALQDIIDRPANSDRETQFAKYGLKPPKRFSNASQPALDIARIESFRERLEILQQQRWQVRRGMSITISHWMVYDNDKFQHYLALIKEKVDFLVGLMGVEDKVHRAMRHDIRALGWHPVFTKTKASSDMSKLRLIKEACAGEYPQYAEATQDALDYLDKEWKDSFQEAREEQIQSSGSEIPGAAAYMLSQSRQWNSSSQRRKSKSPSLLKLLRPRSWRKSSRDDTPEQGRSMSHTPTSNTEPPTPPLSPDKERSKSIAAPQSADAPPDTASVSIGEDEAMTRIKTAEGGVVGTTAVEPVTSMISRHDMWRSSN